MFNKRLSTFIHTMFILSAITLAYAWQTVGLLQPYSLQAFALAVLTYFVIKRMNKSKIWHIAPQAMTIEMALVSFSFLMIIGATGNLDSIFYPLTYIHLFFLVFSTQPATAIATGFGLVLYHYALEPSMSLVQVADLATLPLILIFFLFTKYQYNEILNKELILESADKMIIDHIQNIISPKIRRMKELAPKVNKNILTQESAQDLEEIEQEINSIETSLDGLINSDA